VTAGLDAPAARTTWPATRQEIAMTFPLPMMGAGAATAAGLAAAPMTLMPMTVMMVAQAAFTVGAVAGTAGVFGLFALRRYMKYRERQNRMDDGYPSATATGTGMGGTASDMST